MLEWIWPRRRTPAGVLDGPGKPSGQRSPRACFVAHNTNHVQIFAHPAPLLAGRGVTVCFATVKGHPLQPAAQAAIEKLGYPCMDVHDIVDLATERDVVCFGNDWGPGRVRRALVHLRRKGVPLVGIIEGARFAQPRRYQQVDRVLYWGPSGSALLGRPGEIVGSPIIEKAASLDRQPPARPRVVINYKSPRDHGFALGRAAIAAAKIIDPDYVLSAHPAAEGIPADVRVSHEKLHKLLATASLVITQSSTVIYEALAAGVSVLHFPLAGLRRVEFDDPKGAFQTAESPAHLLELARAYAANPRFDHVAAAAFLDWHVSIDPQRPAAERMAAAIAGLLAPALPTGTATKDEPDHAHAEPVPAGQP